MRHIESTSSGEKTASAVILQTGGYLAGFELNPPSSGLATLKVYDNNTASATGALLLTTATCAAGQNGIYCEFPSLRCANKGIYAVLSGTTSYTIGFALG